MEFKQEDGRIFLRINDWDAFHMEIIPVDHFISVDHAETLFNQLKKLLKHNQEDAADRDCDCPVQGFTVFHQPGCKFYG